MDYTIMAGSTQTLHHGLSTQALLNKHRAGYKLRDDEMRSLTDALHNENEMRAQGGVTDNPLPREMDPADARAAGAASVTPRTLSQAPAPVAGAKPTGVALTKAYTPPGHGGIDVNSYTGSMFAAPGSPNAAKPIAGYQPSETSEAGADRILRQRFGAPPNERGTVDVARGGAAAPAPQSSLQPVTPRPLPQATAQPLAPPITPPAREQSNPLTGDAPSLPQGGQGDISAQPAGPTASPTALAPTPPKFTGGFGPHLSAFAKPDTASVYDNYTKQLFADALNPIRPAPDNVLQRAPMGNPAESPIRDVPASAIPRGLASESPIREAPTLEPQRPNIDQTTGLPYKGAGRTTMQDVRRIGGAVKNFVTGGNNPAQSNAAFQQRQGNYFSRQLPQRVGNPREQDLAAAGSP